MYIYNNIFFSKALDPLAPVPPGTEPPFPLKPPPGVDELDDFSNEHATHRSASADLRGIQAYNEVDIPGLHTVGTAVGRRCWLGRTSQLHQQCNEAALPPANIGVATRPTCGRLVCTGRWSTIAGTGTWRSRSFRASSRVR